MALRLKSPDELRQAWSISGRPHFFKKRAVRHRIDVMTDSIAEAKKYIEKMQAAIRQEKAKIKVLESKEKMPKSVLTTNGDETNDE